MPLKDYEEFKNHVFYYDTKDQLKNYVYSRSQAAFEKGNAERDKIMSLEELNAHRDKLKMHFIQSIGGLPETDCELNPKLCGVIQQNGYRIEKIIFNSRRDVYVTSNLYIPDGIAKPTGAVLFLHGHNKQSRMCEEYQIVLQSLVKAGLVVLALDPVGQGERYSYYDSITKNTIIGPCCPDHDQAGAQCLLLGDNIAHYMIHDAMRGIDYLCTRPEVDTRRIGVTGNSGGGTQTSMIMICDDRIAAAAPATFITNRESYLYVGEAQDHEQIWKGFTSKGYDHEDIILSMAPNPVLILAVKHDFFPIEGTRETYNRAKRIYKLFGAESKLELFEDNSNHKYTSDMACRAAEFFSFHLNGEKITPQNAGDLILEHEKLYCTVSGQVVGEIDGAKTVFDENCERLDAIIESKAKINDDILKQNASNWLNAKTFAGRMPCDPVLMRRSWKKKESKEEYDQNLYTWWSQKKILSDAVLIKDKQYANELLPVTLCLWLDGISNISEHLKEIDNICKGKRAAFVIDISGYGMLEPNPVNKYDIFERYGTNFKLTCDLIFLNDSLAALRIYELLKAFEVIRNDFENINGNDIEVFTCGRLNALAEIACFLDGGISKIKSESRLESFTCIVREKYYCNYDIQGIILPGILKYCDLPDIRRWVNK